MMKTSLDMEESMRHEKNHAPTRAELSGAQEANSFTVILSDRSSRIAKAFAIARSSPAGPVERINELKARFELGALFIPTGALADALIAREVFARDGICAPKARAAARPRVRGAGIALSRGASSSRSGRAR